MRNTFAVICFVLGVLILGALAIHWFVELQQLVLRLICEHGWCQVGMLVLGAAALVLGWIIWDKTEDTSDDR